MFANTSTLRVVVYDQGSVGSNLNSCTIPGFSFRVSGSARTGNSAAVTGTGSIKGKKTKKFFYDLSALLVGSSTVNKYIMKITVNYITLGINIMT